MSAPGPPAEEQGDRDPLEPGPSGEPVEEELEQAGVGALVGRAGEHDEVRLTHLLDQVSDVLVGPVEDRRAERDQVDDELWFGTGQLPGDVGRRGVEGAAGRLGVPDDDA